MNDGSWPIPDMHLKPPNYRWSCHKCSAGNDPGLTHCSSCAFPAIANACEIAEAKGEPNPMEQGFRAIRPLAWAVVVFAFPWY